jgi:hypothetical protein
VINNDSHFETSFSEKDCFIKLSFDYIYRKLVFQNTMLNDKKDDLKIANKLFNDAQRSKKIIDPSPILSIYPLCFKKPEIMMDRISCIWKMFVLEKCLSTIEFAKYSNSQKFDKQSKILVAYNLIKLGGPKVYNLLKPELLSSLNCDERKKKTVFK